MKAAVIDASVVLKWFADTREPQAAAAMRLRRAIESKALGRWSADHVVELAHIVRELPLQTDEPALTIVAEWVGRGLTAYDAAYVALAVTPSGIALDLHSVL